MSKVVLGVAGLVLIGGWYVMSMGGDTSAPVMSDSDKEQLEAMKKEDAQPTDVAAAPPDVAMADKAMMDDTEMMDKDVMDHTDEMMKPETGAVTRAGMYTAYDASQLASAAAGDVVLFFKASWCPSCRTLDADIKANFDSIPASLTILEVDYDTATELKKQYGVTTQHTLVQVDQNGTLIKKWSGGSTLASMISQVQ